MEETLSICDAHFPQPLWHIDVVDAASISFVGCGKLVTFNLWGWAVPVLITLWQFIRWNATSLSLHDGPASSFCGGLSIQPGPSSQCEWTLRGRCTNLRHPSRYAAPLPPPTASAPHVALQARRNLPGVPAAPWSGSNPPCRSPGTGVRTDASPAKVV